MFFSPRSIAVSVGLAALTASVLVAPAAHAADPVAVADAYTVAVDTPFTPPVGGGLLANDLDLVPGLGISISARPVTAPWRWSAPRAHSSTGLSPASWASTPSSTAWGPR